MRALFDIRREALFWAGTPIALACAVQFPAHAGWLTIAAAAYAVLHGLRTDVPGHRLPGPAGSWSLGAAVHLLTVGLAVDPLAAVVSLLAAAPCALLARGSRHGNWASAGLALAWPAVPVVPALAIAGRDTVAGATVLFVLTGLMTVAAAVVMEIDRD